MWPNLKQKYHWFQTQGPKAKHPALLPVKSVAKLLLGAISVCSFSYQACIRKILSKMLALSVSTGFLPLAKWRPRLHFLHRQNESQVNTIPLSGWISLVLIATFFLTLQNFAIWECYYNSFFPIFSVFIFLFKPFLVSFITQLLFSLQTLWFRSHIGLTDRFIVQGFKKLNELGKNSLYFTFRW